VWSFVFPAIKLGKPKQSKFIEYRQLLGLNFETAIQPGVRATLLSNYLRCSNIGEEFLAEIPKIIPIFKVFTVLSKLRNEGKVC
jgi:hypothetical protein